MFSVVPRRKFGNGSREVYPLPRLRNEFETIMNRFFGGLPESLERWGYPETYWGFEMEETDKAYLIHAEAPGFDAKDFEIYVTGNLLTLKAEQKEKTEKKFKEESEFLAERRFERYVTLPTGAEAEKIEVSYKNGILEVYVPKCEEAKPLKIPVRV